MELSYHDPFIPEIEINTKCFSSIELTEETISNFDLVIITTDHTEIDYVNLVEQANAVLDTRGVTRKLPCQTEKVTLL